MRLAAIFRYPVKSMMGEALEAVTVDGRGLVGDRGWAITGTGDDQRLGCGKDTRRFRRMDPVFDCRATLAGERPLVTLPSGATFTTDDPMLEPALRQLFSEPVRLVEEGALRGGDGSVTPFQDAGQVSLVGTATLAALARQVGDERPVDPRRFRVNLVVATDEPWIEERWIGRPLTVGEVGFTVVKQITRCRTIDAAQGTDLVADGRLLKQLGRERQARLGIYADVCAPGRLAVGDRLTLA